MPLKCLLNGDPLLSFLMEDDEWNEIKKSYSSHELIMSCCGTHAIPKVSKLGTRFFAHKPKSVCGSAGESAEHLHAKWVIAHAAAEAGWIAETEVKGKSPNNEEWIADVLCMRGNTKVAFEVQLSSQTQAERDERQARYAASGVRACWLSRRLVGTPSRDVPDFTLIADSDPPRVVLSGSFTVSLDAFVHGTLGRSLRWFAGEPGDHPLWVSAYQDCCRSCGAELLLIDRADLFTPDTARYLSEIDELVDVHGLISVVEELRRSTPELTPVGWVSDRQVGANRPNPDCGTITMKRLRNRREIEDAIFHMTRFIAPDQPRPYNRSEANHRFVGATCQHCGAAFDAMYALNAEESRTSRRYSFATKPVRLLPSVRNYRQDWAWRQPPGTRIELPA